MPIHSNEIYFWTNFCRARDEVHRGFSDDNGDVVCRLSSHRYLAWGWRLPGPMVPPSSVIIAFQNNGQGVVVRCSRLEFRIPAVVFSFGSFIPQLHFVCQKTPFEVEGGVREF